MPRLKGVARLSDILALFGTQEIETERDARCTVSKSWSSSGRVLVTQLSCRLRLNLDSNRFVERTPQLLSLTCHSNFGKAQMAF
jgi:hypothetical protein